MTNRHRLQSQPQGTAATAALAARGAAGRTPLPARSGTIPDQAGAAPTQANTVPGQTGTIPTQAGQAQQQTGTDRQTDMRGTGLRLRFVDNVCHLSAELKGSLELDSILAREARRRNVAAIPLCWHKPVEFEQLFGLERRHTVTAGSSWVDDYVLRLFTRAMAQKATDIHITYMGPYAEVSMRRMGLIQQEECLDGAMGLQLIRAIFQGERSQAESGFSEHERYDGRIADQAFLPHGLFAVRLHTEPIQSPYIPGPGLTLSMRLLLDTTSVQGSLSERMAALGFTAEQQESLASFAESSGMSVISGPTGHGKTTVLKHILESLAQDVPTRNYYSLEDPPEYTILGVRQLNVCTKAVSDHERERALLEALAGLMRADPDVILLGEIRYLEAARAAVNAALTGHSVWTTVHASSGINVLARFQEMGLPLASVCSEGVLTGVSYQRLLPVLCPACKVPLARSGTALPPRLKARLAKIYRPAQQKRICVRGRGCPVCDGMGLAAQKVAAEVIPLRDPKLMELLRAGRMMDAWLYWIRELSGMTHIAHARERVAAGEVDPRLAEERLGTTLDADLVLLKTAAG